MVSRLVLSPEGIGRAAERAPLLFVETGAGTSLTGRETSAAGVERRHGLPASSGVGETMFEPERRFRFARGARRASRFAHLERR